MRYNRSPARRMLTVRKVWNSSLVSDVLRSKTGASVQYAAGTTVEAVILSIRTHGSGAFAYQDNIKRLAEMPPRQIGEVIVRLDRLRERYPRITDEVLLELGRLL